MDHLTHCDLLEIELSSFTETLRTADLLASVPTCPDWAVVDLVEHMGQIHRWAELLVRTTTPTRISAPSLADDHPDDSTDPESCAEWIRVGGERLLATLRAADPTIEMYAWGRDQHVAFWSRRQLHETLVHRIDLQLAVGAAWDVDPAAAVDCIDEFFDNLEASARFTPSVAELKGSGSLHLHATDIEGEWMIHLRPGGFDISHGHGKGDVAARGTARDLLGATLDRGSTEPLEIFGDADLLHFWLHHSSFG